MFTIQLDENDKPGVGLSKRIQQYVADFPLIDLDSHFSFRDKVDYNGERTVADAFKAVTPMIESLLKNNRKDTDKDLIKLADLDSLYTELLETVGSMYRNEYVSIFIDVVAAERNLSDNLTPIGFDRFKGIYTPEEGPASVFQVLAAIYHKLSTDYATKNQVKSFTDKGDNVFLPSTQQVIHENTAKGATLTGVFANAAKALAMLLYKNNTLPISIPGFSLKINGQTYNGLSRTEKNSSVNIFHTIDTLINAAIDNVKEEILYHMNISAKNSNQFIASIGMGIPLNDIVKIFAHPLIIELGKYRSYQLDLPIESEVLGKTINLKQHSSSEDSIPELSIADVVESIYSGVLNAETGKMEYSISPELESSLLTYYNVVTKLGDTLFMTVSALSILTEPPTTEEDLHKVLDTWSKIVSISSEKAEDAVTDTEVEDIQKEIDSLVETRNAQLLIDSPSETQRMEHSKTMGRLNSLTKEIESKRVATNQIQQAAKEAQESIHIANSLARRGHTNLDMKAYRAWPFKDNFLANIPHIRRILTSLLKTQSLLESIVWTSRREFNFIANRLFKDLEMWAVNKYEVHEEIKHEFFRFLTSNLTFRLPADNTVISTKVEFPENLEELKTQFVSKDGRTIDAYHSPQSKWNKDFIQKIIQLKELYPDNVLLKSLEISFKGGIMLAADKGKNPVFLAELRNAFKQLSLIREEGEPDRTRTRYSKLQADFFKYAIMKDGLEYTKTTLSYVFPEDFYAAFSREMESRLRSIFSQGYSSYGFAQANVLYDLFKFQYIRNNYTKLPYVHYHKRLPNEHTDSEGNKYDVVYRGSTPRFFTENDDVFMKVKEEEGKTYAIIFPRSSVPYYEFDYDVLEKGFSIDTALGNSSTRTPLLFSPNPTTDAILSNMDITPDSMVLIGHKAQAYPKFRQLARVTKVDVQESLSKKVISEKSMGRKSTKYLLHLEHVGTVECTDPEAVKEVEKYATENTEYGKSSIDMSSTALLKVAGSKNYLIMAPTTAPENPYKGLKVDQELLEKSATPYFGIKPLVVYGIPSTEAIENIDNFFDSIKKDTRTLVFDKDKLYALSPKEGYKLSLEVTKYLFKKLREEKGYQSSNIDSDVLFPLQEEPDC